MKTAADRTELWNTLLNDCIDVIATENALHTLAEKSLRYLNAADIGPLVQHALVAMLKKVQ